ncbi:DUF2612 domain-containing protein [Tropicimonas sp. IMCC34011]|uniref:DUF2612 domain-containing protein n=1 Tax=Tropicimonas sp. IMCC34011 TaxID=2248759 RepID=UPI001E3B46EF|nr:DUF2612 domain-containing protein [Tropicimonas sp. IMCC34011]
MQSRIDRVLTQYRESPNLLSVAEAVLGQALDAKEQIEGILTAFNIDTATGEQLTFIGRRLGWPRAHCICSETPVFGFDCTEAGDPGIVGFCEPLSSWADCNVSGFGLLVVDDDEIYRQMLRVRIYQILGQFEITSLLEAARIVWPDAEVLSSGGGRIVLAPMDDEIDVTDPLLQIWPRILPVALGVRLLFHFGTRPVWGFGEGWGNIADCAGADRLADEDGDLITHEGDDYVLLRIRPIDGVSDWLCPVDTSTC